MRIKKLDLRAFGPFTDHVIDFSSESPGLHIVYGPNEAGKSSCLRALKYLFFRIPGQTSDNFLHPYEKLLIGGCLQQEGGQEITFFRRKKRTVDLFDENDNPVDPVLLSPFLQGMEQEIFESLYGIDHEGLVRGGQDILDQKGDVGQAIFAAGAGLTSLHGVFEELEKEGDDLFRPRASTRAVNEALSQYQELQSKMKQAFLSSREWEDHRRALRTAEQGLEKARELRKEKDREKSRLERLQRALPYIGQRKMFLDKITDLGEVILLPPDFREQRRKLEQERHETRNRFKAANTRMDEIRKRKNEVSLQQNLLNLAGDIEEIYQRLGEYRKAKADRPRLEGMRISCKNAAGNLLKKVRPDLPLDQAETLRSSLSRRKTILNLGNRYEALVQQIEQAERETRKYETSLTKAREELFIFPPAGNTGGLAQMVKLAQRAGDLDGELIERERVVKAGLEDCRDELSRLGVWNGPLDQIGRLAIPVQESVNRFEEELNSIHNRKKQIQKEKEDLQNELRQLLTQINEMEHAGEVPAEGDLALIRSRRDSGWKLIRRQWIEGEDLAEEITRFSPETSLPDAYEGLVNDADQTADRLRREADRVQKHASLKSRIDNLEKRLLELDIESEEVKSVFSEADRRWHETWAPCDIVPLSPGEMRQWISRFEKLRFKLAETEKASGEMEGKEERRQALRDKLLDELRKIGDKSEFTGPELAPVLLYAETFLDSIKTEQTKREKLGNKIDELQQSLATARDEREKSEEKLDQWKARWSEALIPLGLDSNTVPDEVTDFIDSLQGCLDKLAEAEDFRKRIEGIDRDNENFEKGLAHLLEQVAPGLQETEIVQAVSDLHARLNAARQDQAVFQQHLEDIKGLEEEILQSQTFLRSNAEQMTALMALAGCENEEDLDQAEQRSLEYVRLKEKLSDVESTLAQIEEGIPFSDLEEQIKEVDPDALPGQIQALSREIEDRLDPEIQQLTEAIGREKNEMAKMDGSDRAAEFQEESQQVLAKIRRLTEQFIRIKLSSRILKDVIERYREEHQGPVLKEASRYFKDITLDSFAGLRTEIDDQGKSVLIGIRPDGAWVRVEGMSDGTRDQLYLALRLATLESRLASGEPMPFIVDDILINFDDSRAAATLRALARLAEKNQVILFTHHMRIVEIARNMDAKEQVFVHEI